MSELLGPTDVEAEFWDGAVDLLEVAATCDGDAAPVLGILSKLPPPPVPGRGSTRPLLGLLARLGGLDLTAARVVEPHFDAAAIIEQSGASVESGATWGVFASASPVSIQWVPAEAPHSRASDRDAALSGTKRWCSLAAHLDRALMTASDDQGEWMFVLDLGQDSVAPREGGAPITGLRGVPSGPVDLTRARAHVIGDGPDWYTSRPGFAWGGIGVAAVWFGAAVSLGRTLLRAAETREPDQLGFAWLGETDRLLRGLRVQLDDAADRIDAGTSDWALAQSVRGNTANTCWRILEICGEALGPGPLAFDAEHARRVADLTMYLRQHHGARDDAAHGTDLLAAARGAHRPPTREGGDS
ncbi:acyl-CoA dehydrogenase [Pseudoclavibacter helvolus]|uniref:acyl-CoA dehydrogenase n=1 Tax=Pseudoclavibacter helvolus TaxID=255205 RepID=UPI0037365E48